MAGLSQNDPETNVTPPWGVFPSEQYLIRHWNFGDTLPAADQRLNLIQAFLELDTIPRNWDATGRIYKSTAITRTPTRREVMRFLLLGDPFAGARQLYICGEIATTRKPGCARTSKKIPMTNSSNCGRRLKIMTPPLKSIVERGQSLTIEICSKAIGLRCCGCCPN